mgnify:CR=1 FL=1
MDNIKDIQRKDGTPLFLNDKVIRTNPFGDNLFGVRVYLRAEKIVAAVCLVTRHISESEPARIRIRQTAMELLTSILALRDDMRVSGSRSAIQSKALIRELISLARILSISGNLSTLNAEVLTDAMDELGVLLGSAPRSSLAESVLLTRGDFVDIKDNGMWHDRIREQSKGRSKLSIKDVLKHENIGRLSDMDSKGRKGNRTENILGALGSSKEKLGIKDIVSHFPEYSEKMIQRELKDLVAGGRVKKMGFKRWSMYTLA